MRIKAFSPSSHATSNSLPVYSLGESDPSKM